MRSRVARLASCAIACLALGFAGLFLLRSEQRIADRRVAARMFDADACETANALANARAAEQAYVAAGQSVVLWLPKVSALLQTASTSIEDLRPRAATADARSALLDLAASVIELGNVEKRARDYLTAGQPLMAADVIFAEGVETSEAAARHLETARTSERQSLEAFEAAARRAQRLGLWSSVTLALSILIALAVIRQTDVNDRSDRPAHARVSSTPDTRTPPPLQNEPAVGAAPPEEWRDVSRADDAPTIAMLQAAANLCTDFGRVADAATLITLLERGGDALGATGIIVWLATPPDAELRPVLAHGYAPQTLARLPMLSPSADNAAAAAYRAATLQVVHAPSMTATGAVVAPLIAPTGCVGALSAELKGGNESSAAVQAFATILAAQLAGVLAPSAAAEQEAAAS